MAVLKNRAKMSTSATGTGSPITLGSAEDGYQTFADAGVANADVVRYVIEDGNNWEIGTGTYTATGTTLSRTVSESSNADAAINLSGSATVFIGATAEDIPALYAENPSSPTAPSATGTNAVAIGTQAEATASNSIALGFDAVASGALAFAAVDGTASGVSSIAIGESAVAGSASSTIAIGRNTDATGTDALAIGSNAQSTGSESVALGQSLASNGGSFAAVIDNNTSTYGAQGPNSIAIGYRTKATNTSATSIGRFCEATGQESQAIGSYSIATALRSSSFGYQADATHNNSMSLGVNVTSTATDQVNVGGNTQTVRISETYTLPTTDGTANQVLTTDGAGAVTFADAGGGADLYAANESSPAAQPSATGTNSISIGDSATSSTTHAIAIGHGAKALGGDRAMALGRSYASGEDAFAAAIDDITGTHGAKAQHAVAIGKEALADGQSTLALGRDATATSGVYAAAIGRAYASGTDSLAAAIASNSSSYGAQNTSGIAIGSLAKAHDSGYAIAIGRNNISSGGSGCTVIGGMNNESVATSSIITGGAYCSILGAAQYARAGGGYSKASVHGQDVFASGQFSSVGDAQGAKYILRADTTDATATVLTTNNGTPVSWNQIVAANDTCIMFSGTLVAMQNGAQDQGGWEIKGLLKNDGGTTTLVSSNIQTFADGNGWVVALTADNTNNALAITCTGEAAHNIRWVANIQTSEVTYA